MYKNLLLAALAALAIDAGAASTHRLATFNLRYAGAAADTGAKDWGVRGPYCRDIIINYDFDIFGFQEASGVGRSYRNPNTNLTQLADLEAWLPDYQVVSWDRGGTSKAEYVGAAYKKSRYELLDQGWFFISATPDQISYGWDTAIESHPRILGWLKLKDKTSGDVFIFAATHTNDGWSLDGPYGSQVLSEKLLTIADGLPVMVVADYNTGRAELYRKGLKAYHAAFHDAALEVPSEKDYSLPVTNRQVTWTYQAFNPASNTNYAGREIDMHFYRGMNILERHIITEGFTYNDANYPASDHFPVMVVAEIAPVTPKNIYVNATASAGGDGSISAPYNTISAAVNAADIDDTVYVAAGTYNESFNPPYTVTVSGGWDATFTNQSGETVLDGTGLEYPPVYAHGNISLTLQNVTVRNYASTDLERDGGVHFTGSVLTLENVTIENCSAKEYGGAVSAINAISNTYCETNKVIMRNCVLRNNTANNGGAMAVSFYDKLDIDGCTFADNSATASAGALYVWCGKPESNRIWFTEAKGLITKSAFVNNTSKRSGAVVIDDEMPSVNITMVNCTVAGNSIAAGGGLATVVKTYGGAGIHAKLADRPSDASLSKVTNSYVNLGHLTVVGNSASSTAPANFIASAINVDGGNCRLMNNIIAGNTTNGTNAYADFTITDETRLSKETRNVYTAATTVNFTADATSTVASSAEAGITAVGDMMWGDVEDGAFKPYVLYEDSKPTPFVPMKQTSFDGKSIATLTALLRNLEKEFSIDIDRDGTLGTQTKTDQMGDARNAKSVPGAVEYDSKYTAVSDITVDADDNTITANGTEVTVHATAPATVIVADSVGRVVKTQSVDGDVAHVDMSTLAPGLYIVACQGKSLKYIR